MKPIVTTLALGLALSAGLPAWAAGEHGDHGHASASPATTLAPLSDAEVKKVDKEQGKITLKHGPIENMGMPGMTMVFRVQHASMLDQVKAGDKVRFRAEKMDGVLVVTQLEMPR